MGRWSALTVALHCNPAQITVECTKLVQGIDHGAQHARLASYPLL